MTVPDALIEWGLEPTRVLDWPRDWAREVQELARASETVPLDEKATQRFLARLEALVVEAIRAERSDLLVGLDVQTMEWLGLSVAFDVGAERVTVGREGTFTWSEVRVLHTAWQEATLARDLRAEGSGGEGHPEPDTLAPFVLKAMALVRDSGGWPEARLGSVKPREEFTCVACSGVLGVASVELDGDLHYCGRCWAKRIDEPARRAQGVLDENRRKAAAIAAAKRPRSN